MRTTYEIKMTECAPDALELERLFTRNLLSRRQFVAALTALGASAGGIAGLMGATPEPALAEAGIAQYLVLIVMDAFRPDYIGLAPMPALRSLIERGTTYDRAWVAQMESETPTGHATLSTGSLPRRDGIIGFEWRDPKTSRERLDGWPPGVLAGDMDRDLKAAGTSSIPQVVKTADPKSMVVALSSEKVYAADAMGGYAADYILYHQRSGPQNRVLVPSAVRGHRPPEDFFRHPDLQAQLPMKHFTDWDYLSNVLALAALDAFRPRVLMVNLPGADYYGHPYGGPASPGVMAQVVAGLDRTIARIVGAYQKAGIYDQTLFVVTADHGMVPNDRAVDGATTKATVKAAGGHYLFHTGGTAADIYLQNYWHGRAVAAQMSRLPGVAAAYYQADQRGQYEYSPAPGPAIDPALDAAYQYLLSTFAGSTAPDVVTPFRENTIGGLYKSAHGDHGGFSWGVQHVPLVMAGPGVRTGTLSHFPARLTDVAPTALRLLGLPADSMDGIILADTLLSSTGEEVAAQSRLSGTLTGYQDALITQSVDNIAEDQAAGVVAAPSSSPRP